MSQIVIKNLKTDDQVQILDLNKQKKTCGGDLLVYTYYFGTNEIASMTWYKASGADQTLFDFDYSRGEQAIL
jgi:hypothetical protein